MSPCDKIPANIGEDMNLHNFVGIMGMKERSYHSFLPSSIKFQLAKKAYILNGVTKRVRVFAATCHQTVGAYY
jgi:hypothetical protein